MRYSSGHWKTDTLSHSSEFEKKKDLRTVIRMTLRSTSQIGKWSKIYNVLNVLIYLFINVSKLSKAWQFSQPRCYPFRDTCGSVALDVYFTLTASDSHTALSLSWHLSVSAVQVSVTLIAVSVWFSTHYSLLFFFSQTRYNTWKCKDPLISQQNHDAHLLDTSLHFADVILQITMQICSCTVLIRLQRGFLNNRSLRNRSHQCL